MMLVAIVVASKLFVPPHLDHYLQLIVVELENRLANYVREGDELRSDAMQDILPQVQALLDQARVLKLPVPSFAQVRAMRAG